MVTFYDEHAGLFSNKNADILKKDRVCIFVRTFQKFKSMQPFVEFYPKNCLFVIFKPHIVGFPKNFTLIASILMMCVQLTSSIHLSKYLTCLLCMFLYCMHASFGM